MKCQRLYCGGRLLKDGEDMVCLSCGRTAGEPERGSPSVDWVYCRDCGRAFPSPEARNMHEAQHELRAKNGGHPTEQARKHIVSGRPTDISRTW